MDGANQANKAIIAIVVVVLLGAATTGIAVFGGSKKPSTSSASVAANTGLPSSSLSGSYKDGTYKETAAYTTPGGTESLSVSITLSGGVIIASDVQGNPTTREAEQYQGFFLADYKAQVVGKKISDVSLSRVAGSSLTSGGFNDALDKIKSDARA